MKYTPLFVIVLLGLAFSVAFGNYTGKNLISYVVGEYDYYTSSKDPWHVPEGEFCDYCLGSQMTMRWCFENKIEGDWKACQEAYQDISNYNK